MAKFRQEAHGVGFLLLAIAIIGSVISFSPSDIPFLVFPYSGEIVNWFGKIGAYFSFLLRFFLGWSSLIIALICGFLGIAKLFHFGERNWRDTLNPVSCVLFLLFSSAFFSLLCMKNGVVFSFSAGGLLGFALAKFFLYYFGVFGAYVLLFGLFLLSFIMLTHLSIWLVVRLFIRPLVVMARFVNWMKKYLVWFLSKVKEKVSIKLGMKQSPLFESGEDEFGLFGKDGNEGKNGNVIGSYEGEQDEEEQDEEEEIEWEEDEEDIEEEKDEFGKGDREGQQEEVVTKDLEFDMAKKEGKRLLPPKKGKYKLPPIDLLDEPIKSSRASKDEIMVRARIIEQSLSEFNIPVRVINVESGPVITRYELEPAPGVKIQRIVNLSDDLALNLKASAIRVVAPIPGKGAVGIEVPNPNPEPVFIRDIISCKEFKMMDSPLTLGLGKDVAGHPVVADLRDMPHLLIAGTTGSGKTVCLNALIISMLMKASPENLRFILVDPKLVEMTQYKDLPHLLCPVVTRAKDVSSTLNWLIGEMEKRYQILAREGVRNIRVFNQKNKDKPMPYIVLIIDELADIMAVAQNEVEAGIARLAQLSRAVGIHLILATQRPSVDVITGVIKANFPARISFKVASRVDSRTVLDSIGAEKLLGKGDMLFLKPGAFKIQRIQGAFVNDREIERIVDYIKKQSQQDFVDDILHNDRKSSSVAKDELFEEAVDVILSTGQASVSVLQRKMRLGYARAARLIDLMEEQGIVGPYRGSKPREVLISREEWLRKKQQEFDVGAN